MIAEIARMAVEKGGHVLFMVHRRELIEQIRATFIEDDIDLTHTTIMTVGRIVRRLDKIKQPSLIITDETHHSLAKSYRDIYAHFADVPRLGFSASPWRLSGQGLGQVYDDMVEGPTVRWLIDNHYLAPFDYYAPTAIDIDQLKKSSTGDYSKQSMDDAIGKAIFGDVVKHYQRLAGGKQAIVYAHSIKASEDIVAAFSAAGISARHADAKTPPHERAKIMADFKAGNLTILSNVDLISEGFNVPDCGVIIMLRPTASLVLDIQQSMRGMRYKPDKRSIIIDHVANCYRFGLPDADRDWTLDGRKRRSKASSDAPAIKSCPQCYAVVAGQVKQCPMCGYAFRADGTDLDVKTEAKLIKVTAKDFKMTTDYTATKDPKDATTPEEIYAIGRARGYKPGWAYHQVVARGWLKQEK